LKKDSYVTLLGAQKAQMVFTNPPYSVAIAGNVSGLGKVKRREFAVEDERRHGKPVTAQHELIFLFKKGTAPHVNNVEVGAVWS
jgi:hypothetical protein